MDQRNISYFIAFILFLLGIFYTVRGHASEHNRYATLNYSQGKYYREKKAWHQSEAIAAFERAHEKFWFLPRISDRSMARSCFTTAMTTATASTPQSKVMAAIVNIMITYGLAALDEWEYINYNLAAAQHHFEMMEFYNDVLNKS